MKMTFKSMLTAGLLLGGMAGADALPIKVKEMAPGLLAKAQFPAGKAFKLADGQVPGGMIVAAEIEEEKGRLLYSFDVKVPGTAGVEEVNVDAMTGKLAGQDHEDDASDKKEAEIRAANAAVKAGESVPGLLAKASYPMDQAVAKVEALVPMGRILAISVEKEGKTLLYAFDVSVEGKAGTEDIDISAKNGILLHWEHLSPEQYAREKLADDKRARAQRAKAAK